MKTTIPIHVDPADLAKFKELIPDLSEIELPKLQDVGRTADETIDRLLGRSRTPVWQWIATGLGLVAVMGAIAAAFLWMRRPMGGFDLTKGTMTRSTMTRSEPATAGPGDAPLGDTAFGELDSALAGVAEA